jgi:hypothetical protein
VAQSRTTDAPSAEFPDASRPATIGGWQLTTLDNMRANGERSLDVSCWGVHSQFVSIVERVKEIPRG